MKFFKKGLFFYKKKGVICLDKCLVKNFLFSLLLVSLNKLY